MTTRRLTAIITREGDWYVALCPELDIASQGTSVEDARAMLTEALELFFETASPEEIARRSSGEIYVTNVEVAVVSLAGMLPAACHSQIFAMRPMK